MLPNLFKRSMPKRKETLETSYETPSQWLQSIRRPQWMEQAASSFYTMLLHHWNQTAANARKAQVKGLKMTTRNRTTYDHDGIPSQEVGFASPYTTHSETHHHHSKSNLLSWLLAAALAGSAGYLIANRAVEPSPVPDVEVTGRIDYIPPE